MLFGYLDPGSGSMTLGTIIVLVFVVAVWAAIVVSIANYAGRKGHSRGLFALFAVLFWPAALLVAVLADDKRKTVAAPEIRPADNVERLAKPKP